MPPQQNPRQEHQRQINRSIDLSSDVIGVIATFLPPTTRHQQRLMLVNHTWYQGVVQQDGMKPKPNINWPLDAMKQRKPRKLKAKEVEEPEDSAVELLSKLAVIDEACGPFVESLDLSALLLDKSAYRTLRQLKTLSEFVCPDMVSRTVSYLTQVVPKAEEGISQLKSLTINDCDEFLYRDVEFLCHHHPNITCLRLLNVNDDTLPDAAFEIIATHLRKLERFEFDWTSHISNEGMKHLSTLEHLTDLNCGSSKDVTDSGLLYLARHKHGEPITTLCMRNHNEHITGKSLQHFTSLTELTLNGCTALGKDLGTSLAKMPMLRKLDVINCIGLQEGSFCGIEACAPHLSDLTVYFCEFGDEDMHAVSKCTNLTSLDLGNLRKLTIEGVEGSLSSLQKLQSLSLICCEQMNEAWISTICHALSDLRVLSLKGLYKNSFSLENSVKLISSKLCRLTEFELFFDEIASPAPEVSDASMQQISTELHYLTTFVLGGVVLTDAGLLHLSKLAPSLQELSLRHVHGLSDKGLVQFFAALRGTDGQLSLDELHLDQCAGITRAALEEIEEIQGDENDFQKTSFLVRFAKDDDDDEEDEEWEDSTSEESSSSS